MKNKKRLSLLLSSFALFSVGLVSCMEPSSPTGIPTTGKPTISNSTTQKPTTSSTNNPPSTEEKPPVIPDDDRPHVSGPNTTEMPDKLPDNSNPADDEINKPDINPVWANETQKKPGDYNIYFYSAKEETKQKNTLWLWNNASSVGLKATESNVKVQGLAEGYSLNAIYLNYDKYYYDYSDWANETEGFFIIKKETAFTGAIVRPFGSITDAEKSVNIDLPKPTTEAPFNLYIAEKADGEAKAFTNLTDFNAFLTAKIVPAVWPKDSTKQASDVNFYYYSESGFDNVYLWDFPAAIQLPATDKKKLPGVEGDYEFNAIYLQYGVKYYGETARWSKDDPQNSITFTLSADDLWTNILLKKEVGNKDNNGQSKDAKLPLIDGNTKNYYIVEKNASLKVYTTIEEVNNALNPAPITAPFPGEETEPQDINIYFTAGNGIYNEGWVTGDGKTLTGWKTNGAPFTIPMSNDLRTVDGIENYKFKTAFIQFGKTYTAYDGWDTDSATKQFSFADLAAFDWDDIKIFGGSAAQVLNLDLTKLVADANGKYNLFFVANSVEGSGNILTPYYSIEEFNKALNSTPTPTPSVSTPGEEATPQDINIYFTASTDSYNEGWVTGDGKTLTGWKTNGAPYTMAMSKDLKEVEGIANYKFKTAFIQFGKTYTAYDGWNTDSDSKEFSFADYASFDWNNIKIFGGSSAEVLNLDLTKAKADADGKYNLFFVAQSQPNSGNVLVPYYSIQEAATALNKASA